MAYVKNPTWQDGEAGGTRIDAVDLNHIEDGIEAAAAIADAAQAGLAGKAETVHTHTASQVTDLDAAIGDKAAVAVLNSTFGSTGGAPIKPWQPPARNGGELATVSNLYSNGAFTGLVSGATSLSLTGTSTAKKTRLIIKGNGAYYYRLAFDYDATTLTGADPWWNITVAWKNTGDGSAGGVAQVLASKNMESPKSGRAVFDLEYPLSPSGSVAGLELQIEFFSSTVTGGTATVTNVSLQAVAGPSRMCYWTGQGPSINNEQAFMRYHWDANERRWYVSFEAFGKASNTYQYGGIVGLSELFPFNDPQVVPDPTFLQPQSGSVGGNPGRTGLLKTGAVATTMRLTNNDQILVAQPLAGGAFEYRGNVHGGETLNGSVVAKVHDDDSWRTVTGELDQTGIFAARRFQWTWPTKLTCTGDASHFATVDHIFTCFPDGITRCDRTTTFTRNTNVSSVFEWMASYDPALPRIGRMGRGGDVTTSIDAFTHAAVPAAPTVTTATTGGTLAAATYSYQVSALTALGETLASSAGTVTTTGTTSKNTVAWSAVTNATGYRIYGRTANAWALLATVGPVLSWDDTGANGPSGLPPKEDTGRVMGSRANVMPQVDDRATWACWYDPVSGWAHGNIYDRESMLARTGYGLLGGSAALVALSGIVKNYNMLMLDAASVTVPSGTAWTATHWSFVWRPENPERFHHEIAVRAASLAALESAYPTT